MNNAVTTSPKPRCAVCKRTQFMEADPGSPAICMNPVCAYARAKARADQLAAAKRAA